MDKTQAGFLEYDKILPSDRHSQFLNYWKTSIRNLNRPRGSHGSISVDGLTMIIGGASCAGGMHGCGP